MEKPWEIFGLELFSSCFFNTKTQNRDRYILTSYQFYCSIIIDMKLCLSASIRKKKEEETEEVWKERRRGGGREEQGIGKEGVGRGGEGILQ